MEQSGELLKQRKAAGLTRAALAGMAGCSPAFIQMLEGGYIPRRGAKVEAVRAALAAHAAVQNGDGG